MKFAITLVCYIIMVICNLFMAYSYTHCESTKASRICYYTWFSTGSLCTLVVLWLLAELLVGGTI